MIFVTTGRRERKKVRQADITRALKAAKAAGHPVSAYTVYPDRIVVTIANTTDDVDAAGTKTELEAWRAKNARQT